MTYCASVFYLCLILIVIVFKLEVFEMSNIREGVQKFLWHPSPTLWMDINRPELVSFSGHIFKKKADLLFFLNNWYVYIAIFFHSKEFCKKMQKMFIKKLMHYRSNENMGEMIFEIICEWGGQKKYEFGIFCVILTVQYFSNLFGWINSVYIIWNCSQLLQ